MARSWFSDLTNFSEWKWIMRRTKEMRRIYHWNSLVKENTCILTKSIRMISDSLTTLRPPMNSQFKHVTCSLTYICVFSVARQHIQYIDDVSKNRINDNFSFDENNMSITRHLYKNFCVFPYFSFLSLAPSKNWTTIKNFFPLSWLTFNKLHWLNFMTRKEMIFLKTINVAHDSHE